MFPAWLMDLIKWMGIIFVIALAINLLVIFARILLAKLREIDLHDN